MTGERGSARPGLQKKNCRNLALENSQLVEPAEHGDVQPVGDGIHHRQCRVGIAVFETVQANACLPAIHSVSQWGHNAGAHLAVTTSHEFRSSSGVGLPTILAGTSDY
jgi:hypothetical protein